MTSTDRPLRVRLTEDYLDLAIGLGYPEGTILVRQSSGQYAPEGTTLGQGGCVAYLALIIDICEPIE